MIINKWKLYCETESAWVHWFLSEDDDAPTKCPNNEAHTITSGSASIESKVGEALNFNETGDAKVTQYPAPGSEYYGISWNFCDECCWVENAVLVEDFEMRDSGDLTKWDTRPGSGQDRQHVFWIDINHGRLPFEDNRMFDENIITGEKGSVKTEYADYIVAVKVLPNGQADIPANWVLKTEDTDYYVDYTNGEVIFSSALTSGDRVKSSFRKSCGTYLYTLEAPDGYKLTPYYAEAHATSDFVMTGWVVRAVWVGYPDPPPTMIMVPGSKRTYKTFIDLLTDSTKSLPIFPASGGTQKIGNYTLMGLGSNDFVQLPFDFFRVEQIKSSQLAQYRVTLEKAWEGTFANIVLYCGIEEEET